MRILIACEFSGIVRDAFKAKGHDVWSCDLLPTERPGNHILDDVLKHLDDGWDMMIAFPPCTHLASSGASHFKQKIADGRQQKAIDFFMTLINAPINKICIENPVGIMSSQFRKPDQIIQPHWFGEPFIKKTCLWLKNIQKLVPSNMVAPEYYFVDSGSNYKNRKLKIDRTKIKRNSKERSVTFVGIAEGMAEQWGNTNDLLPS